MYEIHDRLAALITIILRLEHYICCERLSQLPVRATSTLGYYNNKTLGVSSDYLD